MTEDAEKLASKSTKKWQEKRKTRQPISVEQRVDFGVAKKHNTNLKLTWTLDKLPSDYTQNRDRKAGNIDEIKNTARENLEKWE